MKNKCKNLENLIKEVSEHFNEVVIDSFDVCRLVGIHETEEDYYYILSKTYRHKGSNKNFNYLSAVGRPIYLKNVLSESNYSCLCAMLSLNGAPKQENVILDIL